MFPLRAVPGGVLQRAGQTEAAVDLARLAGLRPAGVICEIMNEDGTMARVPHLEAFCAHHGLKMITVKDLIRYRMKHERLVRKVAEASLPTQHGPFRIHVYESNLDAQHHMALVVGDLSDETPVLVRVHSQCLTGDVFGSVRCDCGQQLERALDAIGTEGRRRSAVPAARGAGHRTRPQDPRLRAPGPGARTPSRPTSLSASRPTNATTASELRFSSSWASESSGS